MIISEAMSLFGIRGRRKRKNKMKPLPLGFYILIILVPILFGCGDFLFLGNNQDKSGTSDISAAIFNKNAATKLTHSLVQGSFSGNTWIGGTYQNGGGNIDKDPMFIIPVDASTAPTTAGNLRLKTGSPAINAGKNEYVSVATDLDGSKRIVDGVVDMGAYEALIQSLLPIIIR